MDGGSGGGVEMWSGLEAGGEKMDRQASFIRVLVVPVVMVVVARVQVIAAEMISVDLMAARMKFCGLRNDLEVLLGLKRDLRHLLT